MNKWNVLFCFLLCFIGLSEQQNHPGHMKSFGTGLETRQVQISHELPNPVEFFDKYVITNTPVLFKGVAKKFPTYDKLRNDTYLRYDQLFLT